MVSRTVSRRSIFKGAAGGALALAAVGPLLHVSPIDAQSSFASLDTLDPNLIPPDMGQTTDVVFIPVTGHSIGGTMLDYWRANGSASIYGNPISEPFVGPNGFYSQAFERGIFQYNPAWLDTENPTIRLMPIGQMIMNDRRHSLRADGRRSGSDSRLLSFTPPASNSDRATVVNELGGRFSDVTGFSIAGDFQQWYDSHEGSFYIGEPISEPLAERGLTVQYYENGILYESANGADVLALPGENPAKWGFSKEPIDQGDLPTYDEADFQTGYNPGGVDVLQLAGKRSIVISLSEQTMYVYQGGDTVLTSLISSGLEPNVTSAGEFHVRLKYPLQNMAGFESETGEVTGFQDEDGGGGGDGDIAWEVKDVPNVMYFSLSAEALHGAYWHNNFGNPMSHGCINQPLDVAAFMYGWAPLGTEVTIID